MREWSPIEAAEQFAAFLRAGLGGLPGQFSNEELNAEYVAFVEQSRRVPVAENVLRGVLKDLPGINRRQERDVIDGKVVRKYRWFISGVIREGRASARTQEMAAAA